MDFQTSIKTCFKKYAEFSGRASRSELWWFALFCLIGGIVTAIFDTMVLGYSSEGDGPINLIFTVITTLPTIAVACRRLHDINFSGWYVGLYFAISYIDNFFDTKYVFYLISTIIFYSVCSLKGTDGKNRFGNKPLK